MTTTEQELRELRSRISNQQSLRARNVVARDQALAKVTEAKGTLKEDFGVVTNEEAKAKLAELDTALDAAAETARQKLAEAGA